MAGLSGRLIWVRGTVGVTDYGNNEGIERSGWFDSIGGGEGGGGEGRREGRSLPKLNFHYKPLAGNIVPRNI
jgi:hypothetical protein